MGNFDWSILTDILKAAGSVATEIIKILTAAGVL